MPKGYTEETDEEWSFERVEDFSGGMDAYTRSTLLPPNASQYLENVFLLDNMEARTRPGADLLGAARAAKIQGLSFFKTAAYQQLLAGSGGKVYAWDGAAWSADTGLNLTDADLAFSAAQGLDKLLLTDGTLVAQWDGAAWTVLGTTPLDPPAGCTVLLWHTGRMWAAGFSGASGTAGKEADAVCVSALLSYGNGQWSLTDGSFRVGSGDGDPVIGLVSLPASVPEQAVLGVLKQNSIHIIRTDPTQPITNYQSTMNPEVVAGGLGIVGKRAFAVLGNDLYYVAPDRSFRSLQRMAAAAAQYEVGAPLSLPLQPWIDRINWTHASKIVVSRYRQLALFAVPLDASTVPNYVFVWSGRLLKWVGIWTGWTPNSFEVTRFNGIHRLVHGDNVGNVRQWKDYADATDDATYLDDGTAIPTKTWPKSLLFGEPLNDKDAQFVEAVFGSSNAVVNFSWVADGVVVKTWSKDLRVTGPNLEIDLEFDLSDPTNRIARQGLRDLPPFREAYLRIESTGGWWSLRNCSFAAFVNTISTLST